MTEPDLDKPSVPGPAPKAAAADGQGQAGDVAHGTDGNAGGNDLTRLEQQVLQAMNSSSTPPVAIAEHPSLSKGLGPLKVGGSKTESTVKGQAITKTAVAGK